MAEEDEEKIAFITPEGLFCYKSMPFELKNAGANFQDMINRMFNSQLGQNIEAYIDDILVKTKSSLDIVQDLRETFQTAHMFGLKLNPNKCTFGVHAGKFLDFKIF